MADLANGNDKPTSTMQGYLILIGIGFLLILGAILLYPLAKRGMEANIALATQSASTTIEPFFPTSTVDVELNSGEFPSTLPDPDLISYPNQFGTLILSLREGADIHLFAYQPFLEDWSGEGFSGLPLTRLTSGPYQDITPDISQDGRYIAFSSNRNGPWDIYILDLESGEIQQFTNTPAYDANPSWSPDGQWLVFDSYQIDNLEILIQDVDQSIGPIPLTNNKAADYAPDWSPQGRWISFISDRSGKLEVWYADLDLPQEDKAVPIYNPPGNHVQHPTWSGDGRYLTWGLLTDQGDHQLVSWDSQNPEEVPTFQGTGDWPMWGKDAELLYSVLEQPHQTYLTAYPGFQTDEQIMLPPVALPGSVEGISWVEGNYYSYFTNLSSGPEPTPIWESISAPGDETNISRKRILELRNLAAPTPAFNEEAVASFSTLRAAVIDEAGWDFLATLENAYVPLPEPISLGVNLDWLYTGRGMLVNDIPRLADWMVLVKEDFGYQTYWRVYIRAYNQQGYQGRPLQRNIWDLNARYSGNNAAFENGGALSAAIPAGYWVDFTALAEAHGWSRFSTQFNWRNVEEGARHQYFAFTQGLDLEAALLELYSPQEILDLTRSATP